MNLRRAVCTAISCIGAAVLAGGCSSTPPEVHFGAAQPSGAKLGLRAPAGSYLPTSQWPDGCTLLSDQELQAVLPEASDVSRKQQSLDLTTMGSQTHTEHIPAAGCEISFRLPAKDDGTNSHISLMIRDIGDPSLVKKQLQDRLVVENDATALGAAWGGDECYSERFSTGGISPEADCRAGQYYFDVRVSSSADYFQRKGAHDNSGLQEIHDKVLSQLVRTIAARMS